MRSAEQGVASARRTRDSRQKGSRNLENEISKLDQKLRQARSDSQRSNYERQIQSKSNRLVSERNSLGRAEEALSRADEKLAKAQQKLQKEEENERKAIQRKAEQEKKRSEQQARLQRQREERETRQIESERAAREDRQDLRIGELEERLIDTERKAAPPEVGVLLLGSSPEDQHHLRLDKETREIEKRVRAADFRDSIYFRSRLARQLTDLLDDLNEERPTILHFSGHGNDAALAFEGEDGKTEPLDNAKLGKLLEVAATKVRLIVFNSCDSAAQAELAVKHVEIAIGMDAAIDDEDAKVFAGQLYSSIGYGLSVGDAFRQAKFQLEVDGSGKGSEIPRLFSADDVDPEICILVNPGDDMAEH